MQKLIDPELESLSIIYIEHKNSDIYYCNGCGQYHQIDNHGKPEPPSDFWERENLILTNRDVRVISNYIKGEKLVDNIISDWDLITLEINIRSIGLEISRSEALEGLSDLAYEIYHYGFEQDDDSLPYI